MLHAFLFRTSPARRRLLSPATLLLIVQPLGDLFGVTLVVELEQAGEDFAAGHMT